jgi:hypothetical protein
MFGIIIQMFGHNNGSHHSISFNGDQVIPPIMGDTCNT